MPGRDRRSINQLNMKRKSRISQYNCSEKSRKVAARRPGAPLGNRNALKHGRRTREMDAFRARVRANARRIRDVLGWCRAHLPDYDGAEFPWR